MSVEDLLKNIVRVTSARGSYWADCLDRSTNEGMIVRNTLRMIINEEISSIANVLLNEIQPLKEKEK